MFPPDNSGCFYNHVVLWSDPVPPNATVVFEVEVYTVSRGPRSMEAFKEMDQDKDKSLTKEEVTMLARWSSAQCNSWNI